MNEQLFRKWKWEHKLEPSLSYIFLLFLAVYELKCYPVSVNNWLQAKSRVGFWVFFVLLWKNSFSQSLVMKAGSKRRVRVEFGLQSSGFYWVITLGFSGFALINVWMSGFGMGLGIYLWVQVGFDFIGFGLFPLGFSGTRLHH